MAKRNTPPPIRTSGYAWGNERVRLGLSLRALAHLSGVAASYLSLAEAGRLIPTAEQYESVTEALAKVKEGTA